MGTTLTFFQRAKRTDNFQRWYGHINYIYPYGNQKLKNALWNLSDKLLNYGLTRFIEQVDYATNDFCEVKLREIKDEESGKLLQIEHALKLSVASFRSPITGEIETGYNEATLKLLDDVKSQNLEETIKDLQNGADANAIYAPISDYPSVLHVAVLFKRVDIAKKLLLHGADPNGGLCFETPLSIAYDGSIEAKDVIKLLLMYRTNDIPEKRDKWLKRCGLSFDDIRQRRFVVKENPEPVTKHRRIPVTD